MSAYKLSSDPSVVQRMIDGVWIPADPGNRDWQLYQAWLAAGNTPDPAPEPTPDELYARKIAAGIQIASTATPALNGTYALDQTKQGQITGIVTAITAGKGLPGDLPVVPWADINGDPHNFTAADIVNLGKAMEDYIFALSQTASLLRAGQKAEWPAQPVTIA